MLSSSSSSPHYSFLPLCRTPKELAQVHSLLVKSSLLNTTFAFNTLIRSYSAAGNPISALHLFSQLTRDAFMAPDRFTLTFVLNACFSHSGLVNNGLRSFYSMERDHGISPTIEHYVCDIDLLGRAGLIDDVNKFIEGMPMAANGDVWRALLSACKLHGVIKLVDEVEKILLELEPFDYGNFVLLSNLYAKVSRWKDAARVRKMMKDKGVRKIPGCSSIEVHGTVHEFVSGEQFHPLNKEIYEVLNELSNQIFERDGIV